MSNMYKEVDKTWNPLSGNCEHDCDYCYVKSFRWPVVRAKYSGELRLDENAFKSLGKGKTIFVCDCQDLFAESVPKEMINGVLVHCCKYPDNGYLFQSKNAGRFREFASQFPPKTTLCTTVETDDVALASRHSKAPKVNERIFQMKIMRTYKSDAKYTITIEPILKFSESFPKFMEFANPDFVNIGADSKCHGLLEPTRNEVLWLITELEKFTEVRIKNNLRRIIGGE